MQTTQISPEQRTADLKLLFEPKLRKPAVIHASLTQQRLDALRAVLSESPEELVAIRDTIEGWEQRASQLDITLEDIVAKVDLVTQRVDPNGVPSEQRNRLDRSKDIIWQSAYATQLIYTCTSKVLNEAAAKALSVPVEGDRNYPISAVRLSIFQRRVGDLLHSSALKMDRACAPLFDDAEELQKEIAAWVLRDDERRATWSALLKRIPQYIGEVCDLKALWETRAQALGIATDAIQTKVDLAVSRTQELFPAIQTLQAEHAAKQHDLLWISVYVIEIINAVMAQRIQASAREQIGRGNRFELEFHVQSASDEILRELQGDVITRSPYTLSEVSEPLFLDEGQLTERVWEWIDCGLEASVQRVHDILEDTPQHYEQLRRELGLLAGLYRTWKSKEAIFDAVKGTSLDPNKLQKATSALPASEGAGELQARDEDLTQRISILTAHTKETILRTTRKWIEAFAKLGLEHPKLVLKRDQIRRLEHDLQVRLGTAATLKSAREVHGACNRLLKELAMDKKLIESWIGHQ